MMHYPFLLWVVAPHAFPRHTAGDIIWRVRVDCPLPQPLLQIDQDDHEDMTQSRLLYCEHFVASVKAGQALPLQYGLAVTRRVLVFVPEKHYNKN